MYLIINTYRINFEKNWQKMNKSLAQSALKIHFSGTYTQSLPNNVYGFLHLDSALKVEKLVHWKIFPHLYLEDSIFGADSFQKAKNKISLKLQLIIITFFFLGKQSGTMCFQIMIERSMQLCWHWKDVIIQRSTLSFSWMTDRQHRKRKFL